MVVMPRLSKFLSAYPWLGAALVVGASGLVFARLGFGDYVAWGLSGFALLVAAKEGIGMVRAMFKGHLGLDLLAVTAIVATVAVGEYWASVIIVIMLTGGEALEDVAAGRAERELTALLDRTPQQAHRLGTTGDIVDIPATEVAVGDRLLVRPSEIVPVDGRLVSSGAQFDESSLTGESLPVDRVTGEAVLSGSVNGLQAIEIEAVARAEDSQYQRIVRLVRDAAGSKAPLVRLADRYALPFTALSYAIAGLAWWVSGDPVRFAEVLVVATPCPLLIAAPVAFMGGMSRAAKAGIVIKDAGTLERLARVRTVAFDKTGTLTYGHPEVVSVHPATKEYSRDELLALVGSAEQYSTHVLAAALREAAISRGLVLREATSAKEVATHGVEAVLDGRTVVVGKPGFVAERAHGLTRRTLGPGEAAIYVAADGVFLGSVVVRDQLRTEAADTLRRLRALGVSRTVMVTGDVEETAEYIAKKLGLSEVYAHCLPQDKVTIVGGLTPHAVLMVGDGVNDAPVLAVADVGIALGARGSTAASESADVVILLDDVERAAHAVEIGQRTIKIALESIWLGIIISVCLMVLAAFGFLPAVIGALLQEVVDLVAILGALRAVRG
jgi:heavy metal translocating P-type ATPase